MWGTVVCLASCQDRRNHFVRSSNHSLENVVALLNNEIIQMLHSQYFRFQVFSSTLHSNSCFLFTMIRSHGARPHRLRGSHTEWLLIADCTSTPFLGQQIGDSGVGRAEEDITSIPNLSDHCSTSAASKFLRVETLGQQ